MKCPYRKIVMKTECGTEEEFADCYEHNCPLYEPEGKLGNIPVKASCVRADKEWEVKYESNHNSDNRGSL